MKEYIVAIDLGTSCTAYSWKSAVDPTPFVGTPDMKRGEQTSGKSPTALLVQGDLGSKKVFTASAVEAYGREAQDRYATNDYPHGAQLFKRFKMQMHRNPESVSFDDLVNAGTKSTSRLAEMSLEDVFVLALTHIKEKALQQISVTRQLQTEDVSWVLTVPVCCSNPAKHFMRRCATKAGFIAGGPDGESLVMCMEPIAACLALGDSLDWRVYDKYLVIDCGGGTVDISAFEVSEAEQGKLAQVGDATGGPWGATKVDIQFENFLEDFIRTVASDAGERCMDAFFASSGKYRITQAWERAKIGLKNVNDYIVFDLSELSREPLGVTIEDMDEGRALKNQSGEKLLGGFGTWDLMVKPALVQKFFKPSTDKIAKCVAGQLDMPHTQQLTAVVMVGGFSGSAHLQKVVKDCVRRKYPNGEVNVVIPASPDLAVVQGAAHFVSFPQQSYGSNFPVAPCYKEITSAFSYGIITSETGNSSTPTFFDSFIVKGEGYPPNHTVDRPYKVQRTQNFTLFIGSSSNSCLHTGPNRLDAIGGVGALQGSVVLSVAPDGMPVATPQGKPDPTAPQSRRRFPSLNMFSCRSKQNVMANTSDPTASSDKAGDNVGISVQFSLRGIELHVLVVSDVGRELVRQMVPFHGT